MAYSVYNNVISQLAATFTPVRQTLHSKSELQELSSRILKNNTYSPFYILKLNEESEQFVLGAKNDALSLYESIGDLQSPDSSAFLYKTLSLNKKGVVNAHIVNPDAEEEPLNITLHSLATTQFNVGRNVTETSRQLKPGDYRFTVTVNEEEFQFHYEINEDKNYSNTNANVIYSLTDFINKADIGIKAGFTTSKDSQIAVTLESTDTGSVDMVTFSFEDLESPGGSPGIAEHFGLNNVVRFPANAKFTLNGEETESLNNSVRLRNALQVDFIEPSDESIDINYIRDSEKILGVMDNFVMSYNKTLDNILNLRDNKLDTKSLARRISGQVKRYKEDLIKSGIEVDDNGHMRINRTEAAEAIQSGALPDLFLDSDFINSFKQDLLKVSTDPVQYVNKVVVSYPNIAHPAPLSPYVSSMYSGMLFNKYL